MRRRLKQTKFEYCASCISLLCLTASLLVLPCSRLSAAEECRADITEGMGYTVRSVRVQGRWVPPDLTEEVAKIVGVGGVYSPVAVSRAESRVADEIVGKENQAFEFATAGATSVLTMDSCVLDVSDAEHPRQVDVVIRPFYLRVDLYNVGSNVLPVPRSIEPTFFRAVPKLLRTWIPKVGLSSDRAYGVAAKLQTSFKHVEDSGSEKNDAPRLEVSVSAQKSLNHSFYDAEGSLAWSKQYLAGDPRTSWSLGAVYRGGLDPLGDGEYLHNAGAISGHIRLRPGDQWMDSLLAGATVEGSFNRLTDANGATVSKNSQITLQGRAIIDGKWASGFSRVGIWTDGGFVEGGDSYQRLAGFLGYGKEFGSGHQTVGLELIAGGGKIWGSVPEYARFYGGNAGGNFLYDSAESNTLASFPAGPTIRSFGQGSAGSRTASGAIRGGTSFWNLSLNVTIPIPGLSRPLVPDITMGRSTLGQKLKSVVKTAENGIIDDLVRQGLPDNEETEAKAERIINRDIKPAVDFLADHANLYAIKPLLLCDVAQIYGPGGFSGGTRLGLGAGFQVTVVTAKFELGYMYAVSREAGDPRDNLFLRLVFQNIF